MEIVIIDEICPQRVEFAIPACPAENGYGTVIDKRMTKSR